MTGSGRIPWRLCVGGAALAHVAGAPCAVPHPMQSAGAVAGGSRVWQAAPCSCQWIGVFVRGCQLGEQLLERAGHGQLTDRDRANRQSVVASSALRQVPRTRLRAHCRASRADQRAETADRDLERRCCLSTVSACERSEVEIIIDGSCLGNPGPGGWACILRYICRRRGCEMCRCGSHRRWPPGGAEATHQRKQC